MKLNTNSKQRESEHETEETESEQRGGIEAAASRVEGWLTYSSHSYERTPEVLDSKPRHRDVVNPAATRIGRGATAESDVSERLRDLHAERDARLQGNEDRRERLDALRVTQAVCNSLDLTTWERDRVLGVVGRLDEAEFTSRHDVECVAVAVASHVVDAERRAWAGVDEHHDRATDGLRKLCLLTDSEQFRRVREETGLSPESVETLEDEIERELDEHDALAAVGRSPHHDDALPPFVE